MKVRFDNAYLFSAGVILAVTGLAKVSSLLVITSCIEKPVFGVHQPFGMSNMGLTAFAAGVELAVLALICFSPLRWLPCLASGLWGSMCLVARSFFMQEGAHCHCLGWIEAPTVTVVFIAGWLAVGGWVAFWMAWRDSSPLQQPPIHQRTAARVSRGIVLLSIAAAILLWGLIIAFKDANYNEMQNPAGPLLLAIALPSTAIGLVTAIRRVALLWPGTKRVPQPVATKT
jgi:hypothetical protein